MKKSRFTTEQMIAIPNEGRAGATVTELCRRHGTSEQTYYRWKAKFGGMEVSEAQCFQNLRVNNPGADR